MFSPTSQCSLKHGWRKKKDAKRAARQTETTFGGGKLDVYRCPHCGLFHAGHRPPSK